MNKNDNGGATDAKKKISLVITVFAILLLVIVIIMNRDPLKSFFSVVTTILEPILLGAAIAYILNPLLRFLEFKVFSKLKRKGLVRALSIIITYIIAILAIAFIIWVILPKFVDSVVDLGKNYDVYAAQITAFINKAIEWVTSESEFFDPNQLMAIVAEVLAESELFFDSISNGVLNLGVKIFTIVKNIVLALFISVYMLIGKERLYAKTTKALKALSSEATYSSIIKYARISNKTFGKYFIGKILDSLLVSIIALPLLLILKVPYAFLISLIIGTFNIIPFIGIFIGIIISAIIVLIADPAKLLVFILLMVIVQQIDSNIIAPKILGRQTGVSSLGVIIAIVIMGEFFGVVGMIVAVPTFAILFTIIKENTESRLRKKGLNISTTDYYDDPEFTIESEPRKTAARIFFDTVASQIKERVNKNKK